MLIGVSSVFVPFEKQGEGWVKRDDLPRFLTGKEAIEYMAMTGCSWRKHRDPRIKSPEFVQLEWREHSEPDLIREYTDGVGTPEFNLKRRKRR